MIELTRLNGNRMAVNSELILFAESAPDTLLTMVTGEKLIVAETLEELSNKVVACRAQTLAETARLSPAGLMLAGGAALRSMGAMAAADSVAEGNVLDEESMDRMRRRRRMEP